MCATRRHEAALDAAELDTIYREAPIGLALLDKGLHYLKVNRALVEMHGVRGRELVGKTIFEAIPDIAPRITDRFRQVFETGMPLVEVEVTGEMPQRPGMKRTWLQKVSPVLHEGGEVRAALLAVIEITQQKEAEQQLRDLAEREQLMMQELTHRVSNGLALVSSVLHLEARAARSSAVYAAFQSASERVRGLGLIHRHLYGTQHAELVSDVGTYLISLCKDLSFTLLHGSPIRVECESGLTLDPDRMIPLGIMASELVMNAVKHGGRERPEVTVTIHRHGDRVAFTVSDNGKGLPRGYDPTASSGTGMKVVLSQAEQLHGVLRAGRAPKGGAAFIVSFPLA